MSHQQKLILLRLYQIESEINLIRQDVRELSKVTDSLLKDIKSWQYQINR